ncbi:MAG: curli-like amyloid fiber formation chaperone CsgH [Pseudomonadota bacterium]
MTRKTLTSLSARSALGMVGIIAVAACTNSIAADAGNMVSKTSGSLTCSIAKTKTNGMVRLDAKVSSTSEVSGEYRFSVRGNGTNINQGGPFFASSGGDTTVGMIQLSSGAYTVKLDVDAGGKSVKCEDTIRLSI